MKSHSSGHSLLLLCLNLHNTYWPFININPIKLNSLYVLKYQLVEKVLQWKQPLSFFFLIYFYYLEANYFTTLWCVLSYIDMNQPWSYMFSPSRSPLPPLSPPYSSGSSQSTRPEHLSHASHLGWWSVSVQIIYMFRCCCLKTSHPHLLPHSPKVCSVHLCLFFCFAYRVIITIFLNSIYMCSYTVLVFIFLAYFTLYNGLQFHPSH